MSPEAPIKNRQLECAIGWKIRQLRRRKKSSLAELARAAAISTCTMSRIENGRISPSIATLQALATFLNVTLTTFFQAAEQNRECRLVRAGQDALQSQRTEEIRHSRSFGPSVCGTVMMEPCLITLMPGAEDPTTRRPGSVAFVYLLGGELLCRHAEKAYHLGPGDALLFDSGAAKNPVSVGVAPALYISVVARQVPILAVPEREHDKPMREHARV